MEPPPHTGPLPTHQPPPARAARSTSHFFRQHLPRQAGTQYEQNAGQRGSIRDAGPAHRFPSPPPPLRQQRLDPTPQRIVDETLGHAVPPPPRARAPTQPPVQLKKAS